MKTLFLSLLILLSELVGAQIGKTKDELIATYGQPKNTTVDESGQPLLLFAVRKTCKAHGEFTMVKTCTLTSYGICLTYTATVLTKEKHYLLGILNTNYVKESDASWVQPKTGTTVTMLSNAMGFVDFTYTAYKPDINNNNYTSSTSPTETDYKHTTEQQMQDNREKFFNKMDELDKQNMQDLQHRIDQDNKTTNDIILNLTAPQTIFVPAHYDIYGTWIPSYYTTVPR